MDNNNNKYYLYCHTNKINNKKYIGISLQKPSHRWQNGKGYKGCPKFEKAIKKYGWDNFTHEILLNNLTQKEACYLEKEYIEKYDTINNGYNILEGGLDNSKNGGEVLFNKRPINQYDINKNFIKTWDSAQQIERETGYNHSAITSNCRRETIISYNYLWRYTDDCDDIKNIIIKNTNCFHDVCNNKNRKVNQYDLQGNFIKTWDCILDIAKYFNKPTVLFSNCCNRKPMHNNPQSYYKSAYGYQWRYIDDCGDIEKYHPYKLIYEIDNKNNIINSFETINDIKTYYNNQKMWVADVLCGRQKSTYGHRFVYAENYTTI